MPQPCRAGDLMYRSPSGVTGWSPRRGRPPLPAGASVGGLPLRQADAAVPLRAAAGLPAGRARWRIRSVASLPGGEAKRPFVGALFPSQIVGRGAVL